MFWQGDAPCTQALTEAHPVPGAALTRDGLRQAVYALDAGSTLKITHPDVRTHPVSGPTFGDAWSYMIERRPLQDRIGRAADGRAVLASVRNRIIVQYLTDDADGLHTIRPGSVTFRITPRMKLADWSGRAIASDADALLWDRKQCEHIHHELGHVLVAAQTLAEREGTFLALSGTETEVEDGVRAFMDDLDDLTDDRQSLYHTWIAGWGRPVAHTRPYAELPFPWLADANGWDAVPPEPVVERMRAPVRDDADLLDSDDIQALMRQMVDDLQTER